MGITSYDYIFSRDTSLLNSGDWAKGVAFELPLIFIEKQFHITDTRDIYLMRHLVTHLFFLVSVFCGYILVLRLLKNQFIACLGFLLFAFNPRIYAHSYFNSKDIPFLAALIITFTVCQVAFEKNKTTWYILLGMACAYATSIRAMGILFALCVSLFFISDIITAVSRKEKPGMVVPNFVLFIITFCGFLYATWPLLWTAPVHNFIGAFLDLSHNIWHGKTLLNGVNYPGDKLPWTYIPLWFSITIPVLWLLSGIAGLVWVIVSFVRTPQDYLRNTPQRNYLMYAACFITPVISVIALDSTNYDDWRHLYFIYPSFVMLVLFTVHKLLKGGKKSIVIAACLAQIVFTTFFMVNSHPFQQVYFNQLVSHKEEFLRKNYDLEYWGCADKQALEYILAHDNSPTVKVWVSLNPVWNNSMILPEAARKRIELVNSADQATSFMTNFRNHPDDYNYPTIFYEIKELNSTILRVYKLR